MNFATHLPWRRAALAAALAMCAGHALAQKTAAPAAQAPVAATPQASAVTPLPLAAATVPHSVAPGVLGCLIEPSATVEVGTSVIGVIEAMLAERGDIVVKGAPLARLDAKVERAALALAEAKGSNEADIRSAKSQKDFAQKKAARTAELTDLKFVSTQARDQADTEASIAAMRLAQAQEQRVLSRQEVQLARAQLAQRTVSSPIGGVVVDRYVSAGERVENRPIMKVAQIDPLRVEVVLPAAQYGRVQMGMQAKVVPELPGALPVTATVTIVDRIIDPASNTFRARLSLPNRGNALPSGVRCKVEFAS